MRLSVLAPFNIITVIACGEKCIMAYFNKKIQRKSAPGRRRRGRKDNIELHIKQTDTVDCIQPFRGTF
jgi:hypothetical protein